jgi:hypothetical protein
VPYADFGDPQSLNLYGFIGGNPSSKFDSDGHFVSQLGSSCYWNCKRAEIAENINQMNRDFWNRVIWAELSGYIAVRHYFSDNKNKPLPPPPIPFPNAQSPPGSDQNQQQNDKKSDNKEAQRLTNKEAKEAAKKLGYDKEAGDAPFNSHGNKVFTNGDKYITADRDGHSGGTWKMFDKSGNRIGTYNADLTVKIGK